MQQSWAADGRGGTELGFGASVYDSSICLADYLLQQGPTIVSGCHERLGGGASGAALELGAGLGFTSIALAKGLASAGDDVAGTKVICTDGEQKTVDLAASNAEKNGLEVLRGSLPAEGTDMPGKPSLYCTKLFWGDKADEESVLSISGGGKKGTASAAALAGASGPGCSACGSSAPFSKLPFIFGADIVAVPYKDALLALVGTLKRLMTCCQHCGGEVRGRHAVGVATSDEAPPLPSSKTEDFPLLSTALPPVSSYPIFLLGFQKRHHEESVFFEAMREWTDCYRVNRRYIHEDFRKSKGPMLPLVQLLWFEVKE
jgi:Lysine methyltransferase